jgi:hypothetical protein
MPRVALVLLMLLAGGAAAWMLLQGGSTSDVDGVEGREALEEGEETLLEAPGLTGQPGPGRRAPRPTPEAVAAPSAPPEAPSDVKVFVTVTVLDDATGAVLPGAVVWWEPARDPCPRLPREEHISAPQSPLSSRVVVRMPVDAEGRALLTEVQVGNTPSETFDLFARHPGYVMGMACAVRHPGEATIRLKRGLSLQGTVTDAKGTPLADAEVLVRPGAATPPVPGHAGYAATDEQGRFSLDGLVPGALRVRVGREGYFPLELEAEDPSDPQPRTYVLTPAFVVRFRLRTDDGRPVVNPTARLIWGNPPRENLQILQVLGDETSDGVLTQGLSMPATSPTVDLQVKAEGYAAWVRQGEPVPADGGERVVHVTLARDAGQGGLRLVLENERGEPVDYSQLGALSPTVQPLDRQNITSGALIEVGKDLRFPSLPTGRYLVTVRAHAYAPASVEARVTGGTESEVRVRLAPPARLRVKFTANETRIVRFQLLQQGRVVQAIPEPVPNAPRTAQDDRPQLAAGEAGVLLGGLAGGTYEVEVLSEDLRPTRTSVTLREGQTEEVEIAVQRR